MDLVISTRQDGVHTVMAVAGEIDIYSAPTLRQHLDDVVADGRTHVVVDLNGVTFMDSTGLGVLVWAHQQLSANDATLRVVCRQERILRLFRITGTDRIFDLYADLSHALDG